MANECRRLLSMPQGEALGHFCLGLVTLTCAEDQDEPAKDLDRFLEQASEALAAAEAQERAAPSDAEVKLLLGLIHGSKAIVDGGRKNYLTALQECARRTGTSTSPETRPDPGGRPYGLRALPPGHGEAARNCEALRRRRPTGGQPRTGPAEPNA
jgi:hypothetical protein